MVRPDSRILCLCLILLTLAPVPVVAHALGQSYLFLSILETSVSGRVELPVSDVNRALGLTLGSREQVNAAGIAPHIEAIKSYVAQRVRLAPDGKAAQLRLTGHRLVTLSFAQFVTVDFELEGIIEAPKTIDVNYGIIGDLDPAHRAMLVIENNWRTGTFNNEAAVSLTFTPDKQRQTLDLSSSTLWRGLVAMIELGAHHIAIGIDHILFIIALLLPSVMRRDDRHWRPVSRFSDAFLNVVKIVTLFTIAHSITLTLATLGVVHLSSRLVESVIALSIILVALDIVIPVFGQRIWWIVFLFGMFHGFGFASVLSDMGIDAGFTALTLLGFNIGVELGQLIVVAAAFPLLYLLRSARVYTHFGMPAGATALMLIAAYWFIERAFEVDLPAGAILNSVMSMFA